MQILDQASQLRRMISQRHRARAESPGMHMQAYLGGQSGVGTTWSLFHEARRLVSVGRRVLLIDANASGGHNPDLAVLCGIDHEPNIADVFTGKRSLKECIQTNASGLEVVSGAWGLDLIQGSLALAVDQLTLSLGESHQRWSDVLFDLGSSVNRITQLLWPQMDRIILISSADNESILNTYATIKLHSHLDDSVSLALLVNDQLNPELPTAEVYTRLTNACDRFLGLELTPAITQSSLDGFIQVPAR